MATFENTVMIARPIEDVFAFLSDLENIPKWNYAIVETRKVSEGPVGVGTIYRQVRSVPSRSEERLEITTYNPPRQLEIRGQLGPFRSRLFYALDATGEGTWVTNTVEFSSAVLAACSGASPCPVSERPWPPTFRSSRSCWRGRWSGTPWAQTGGIRGHQWAAPGQVNDRVDASSWRRAAGRAIDHLVLLSQPF